MPYFQGLELITFCIIFKVQKVTNQTLTPWSLNLVWKLHFLRVLKTHFETMNCTSLSADGFCSPVIVSLPLNYKVTHGSGDQVGGVLLTVFQW
jgi:hypothetical protein